MQVRQSILTAMQVSPEILTRQNSMGENGKDKYANK